MVVGAFHLVPLIRNTWVEDEVHTVFNEPHNMPMDQLGRIADRLTRNGFNTQSINIRGRLRAQYDLIAQLCEKCKPEWVILVHIQYTRNTNFTPAGLILSQRLILENTFVFIIK